MAGLVKRCIGAFFRYVVARFYVSIAVLSVVVSALAVWAIAAQWNINSDFQALLPRTSDAYKAMQEVGERVGSGSALFVVIDSPDSQANKQFAGRYAQELRKLPQVALAHYHNDKSFFEQHELLYLEADDLEKLYDRIDKKIRDEKKKANPLFVSLDDPDDQEDGGGFVQTDDLEEKYDDLAQNGYKEYLVSDDGYAMTIVVRFVESSTNLEATNALIDKVEQVGQRLDPTSYHPDMTIDYGGGLINRQEEYTSLLDDIQSSAVFTIVGLLLVIGLYFRRVRAIAFVLTPLVMGVLWTLAIGFLIFGELTTVTAFIFAILLGLGIDFSIHLLSGYDHARAEGMDPVEALVYCYQTTGKATVIGAFTTFVTFVVLAFAQFRGLSQFGQVASIGVICTLLAMMVVLPSLILTAHRFLPHQPAASEESSPSRWAQWVDEHAIEPYAPMFLLVAAGLTVFAAFQAPDLTFEENFDDIGQFQWPWADTAGAEKADAQKDAAISAAKHLAAAVDDRAAAVRKAVAPDTFKNRRQQHSTGDKWTSAVGKVQSSTPTVLLFDSAEHAHRVYDLMADRKAAGKLETVRSLGSIYAFLPGTTAEQQKRLAKLDDIDRLLSDEDLSFLDAKERQRLDDLDAKLDVGVVSAADLPAWTKRLFKESGGRAKPPEAGEQYAYQYLIYVNAAIDSMNGPEARRFLGQLQDVRDQSGLDFRIGSQAYIYTAMLDEIQDDGAVMLGIALVIVLLLLVGTFGHPLRGFVAFSPLLLGGIWTLGAAAFLELHLDFFNVVILPVIVGIGVDDGVHFYYHYRQLGPGSVSDVIRQVGSAVVMTSVTSMIGFGGLAVTDYDGLRSMGILAIIGIGSTLVSTLMVLPAVLWLGERYDVEWLQG